MSKRPVGITVYELVVKYLDELVAEYEEYDISRSEFVDAILSSYQEDAKYLAPLLEDRLADDEATTSTDTTITAVGELATTRIGVTLRPSTIDRLDRVVDSPTVNDVTRSDAANAVLTDVFESVAAGQPASLDGDIASVNFEKWDVDPEGKILSEVTDLRVSGDA